MIVDNGSTDTEVAALKGLASRLGLVLVLNAANLGVAKALNQGAEALMDRGLRWAITQDQDSSPAADMVRRLRATAADHSAEPVAIVAPNVIDRGMPLGSRRWFSLEPVLGIGFRRLPCNGVALRNVVTITSGSLVHIQTLRDLGGFDERLFIDFVDTDYCLRAARARHSIVVDCTAKLFHRVGAKQKKTVLGLSLSPTYHSPLRRYYLFRNRVLMIRKHALYWPHWLSYEAAATVHTLAAILFFEPDKWRQFYACFIGTWDGVMGRSGRATRPS